MELLLTAGRLAPGDLALVREVIAWASRTPQGAGEQLSAIIEHKQAQRTGTGTLH
jgi:hypothetical protein